MEPITVTVQEVMEKGSVGLPEAMKMLGCGRTVIFELMRERILPVVKNRSRNNIPRAAIEKYLDQALIQAGSNN